MKNRRISQSIAIALVLAAPLARPAFAQSVGPVPLGERPQQTRGKVRVTPVSALQVAPSATTGRLSLTWGPAAPGSVSMYEVHRIGGIAGGATELIAKLVNGETTFEHAMPTPGAPVQYQVVAHYADETRDVSPWVSYAPPPLEVPALSIVANYNKPTISWQELPGVRYKLLKTPQPGVASYPPIHVYPFGSNSSLLSTGGLKSISETLNKYQDPTGPLADLHHVMHFQMIADNGRGEVIPGQWVPYQPTPHGSATGATGSYWVVPQSNGTRNVLGCVSWDLIPGAAHYGLSIMHGSMTQWPAGHGNPVAPNMSKILLLVAALAQGELTDPVTVRIHPSFNGVVDSQHTADVVLREVQPLTAC